MKRALLFLLLLCVASRPTSAVIDPFYRNRMENGIRAFDQGNWEAAAHQLRIACFGHLDDPIALADGLVRLAIVDVRRGDEDSFRRSFSRLLELEERFSAYSSARISPELKQEFEALAARLVPAQTLRSTDGFEAIAERADVERLAAMPREQRRAQLETWLQAEPGRAEWIVEMAKLELEARRGQLALDWLDRLPAAAAETPPASCLRQQAASEAASCARMDLARPFCQNVPPAVVEFRLQCLVEAGRWPEAASLVSGLDPQLRERRRIVRLERRVANNFDGAGQIEPSVADSAAIGEPSASPGETDTTEVAAPAPTTPADDPRGLERLRQRLASAETDDELAVLTNDAEAFADRHPNSRLARLLSAEIAYLRSDWPAAVRQFRQAGPLQLDEVHLAFYQAVALYESGDSVAAAEVLQPVASRLERSSFVDTYVQRILAPGI